MERGELLGGDRRAGRDGPDGRDRLSTLPGGNAQESFNCFTTASSRGKPKQNAPNPGGGQFGARGKTIQRVNFRAFL